MRDHISSISAVQAWLVLLRSEEHLFSHLIQRLRIEVVLICGDFNRSSCLLESFRDHLFLVLLWVSWYATLLLFLVSAFVKHRVEQPCRAGLDNIQILFSDTNIDFFHESFIDHADSSFSLIVLVIKVSLLLNRGHWLLLTASQIYIIISTCSIVLRGGSTDLCACETLCV